MLVVFFNIICNFYYITKIITNLKNSNSVGWDNIPTNILKTLVNTLVWILPNLTNKSLAQGLFPQSLKTAKIFTLFNSKDRLNIPNYRLISFYSQSSVKFIKKYFIVYSMTISPIIIYYHPHNLVSDQEHAQNIPY